MDERVHANRMTENPDVLQKPARTEPAKSTLPQPGRPVPSRAYPGALIVVEGTDGSGKSTQLYLLKRWLEIGGYRLHFTEWNSSPLVKSATRRGKQRRLLTPTTFSLLHAADHAAAAGRLPGPCRSLRLYGVRARCRAGLSGAMGAEFIPVCPSSGHNLLFPCAAGRGGAPHSERAPQTQILRSGHGFGHVV